MRQLPTGCAKPGMEERANKGQRWCNQEQIRLYVHPDDCERHLQGKRGVCRAYIAWRLFVSQYGVRGKGGILLRVEYIIK